MDVAEDVDPGFHGCAPDLEFLAAQVLPFTFAALQNQAIMRCNA